MQNCAVVKPFFYHLVVQIYYWSIYYFYSEDDKPDVVLQHVCTNDTLSDVNDTELDNNIINIGLTCKNHDVNKVFILSVLVKKSPKLNSKSQRSTTWLWEENGFCFIYNEMIINHLWKYGIHLQDNSTSMLSGNFNQVLNFLFEDHSWLQNIDQTNEHVFDSELQCLSNLRKACSDNPIIG